MRLLLLFLLATPAVADELRDAVEAGDPKAIAEVVPSNSFTARELVDTCSAAADLALRIDPSSDRAAWDKAAARLEQYASRGKGLYGAWAQREVDVMKWRLKQAHDPDDAMALTQSLRDLTRVMQETRDASRVHVRMADHLVATSRYKTANWYSCIGGLVYLHKKMELLHLKKSSIEVVQAMFEWAEAESFLRAEPPKTSEALASISAGVERLAPILKEKEPPPEATRLFNDLVLLGQAHLALKRECKLTIVRDSPRGIRYGFAPSAAWHRVGDTIWQIAPGAGALRSIHVSRAEGKDPIKVARALMKQDKKRIKSKRKIAGPKKAPVNEKIKTAVFYKMTGLDAAKRFCGFRTYVIGKRGGPLFVVRIVDYKKPAEGADPGVELFLRYLSLA